MTKKELVELLSPYPDDMPVKILVDHEHPLEPMDMDDDRILHTSETAHADASFPEDEWDSEDGKIVLGNGKQYLLINPVIL